MKQRCSNPNIHNWDSYGGRGIEVCNEWNHSFEAFLADMGERPPNATLDRINVNGNYELDNVRWASIAEQVTNRRNS